MIYDTKVLRSSDSTIEIWTYEHPIASSRLPKEKSKRQKSNFDGLSTSDQQSRLNRIAKYRKSVRWTVTRLVDANFDDRTSFLTLTTKKNIDDRHTFNLLFDKFLKRLNYNIFGTKKRLLKYLAVLERQSRGAFHAHIIIFDVPFISHKELLKLWNQGSVYINKIDVDSKSNRGRYVSKYFVKGAAQELLESYGKKAYYSSRNLKHPKVYKINKQQAEIDDYFDVKKVLYEAEYTSRVFVDGELLPNKVSYKKVELKKSNLYQRELT
ncbi:Rep protein [Weissella confusa]|uniref:rolling circle replication-associated protein n=1 Tax=Weissella confusa TaxID=1583 RepID=UPI0039838CA2